VDEQTDIVLLAADVRRRRVVARGGEIDTVGWAMDLDEAFRAAAYRTDLFADCRTCTSGFSLAAEGTNHSSTIV